MSAEDYLELPKRIDLIEHIDLPKRTMDDYLQFEKELLLEIDDDEIEALTPLHWPISFLQWCNGAIYDEHKNGKRHRS